MKPEDAAKNLIDSGESDAQNLSYGPAEMIFLLVVAILSDIIGLIPFLGGLTTAMTGFLFFLYFYFVKSTSAHVGIKKRMLRRLVASNAADALLSSVGVSFLPLQTLVLLWIFAEQNKFARRVTDVLEGHLG